MPRNGSGTMSVSNSFSSGNEIQSSPMNANFTDVASEITNSLPRDGQAAMTGQMKAATGTAAAPSITFGTDTNTGFYRSAGDTIGISCGGSEVGTMTSSGYTGAWAYLPSGTVMLFAQTAAPTGWTKGTTHDDKAIRIVSGTASTGGTTAFSSVLTSRTITEANLPAHTHGPGTLTTDTEAGHPHGYTRYNTLISVAAGGTGSVWNGTSSQDTGNGGAHSHDLNAGVTDPTGGDTAMDFAIQYVDVIMATKD